MVILIAGTRSFDNYKLFCEKCEKIISFQKDLDLKIISGCANGADNMAHDFAMEIGCDYQKYKADWDKLGKNAGPIRNLKMAINCDAAIFFWDGKSRGTADCISKVKALKKKIRIIRYDKIR